MKPKTKYILWYHIYTQTVENALSSVQIDELNLYLKDKIRELNLNELIFAYYHDHFHILFSVGSRYSPSEMEKKILGAVSWFITAMKGETVDFIRDSVIHTVYPSRIPFLLNYLDKHVEHHLDKEVDAEFEKTVTQWQKLKY